MDILIGSIAYRVGMYMLESRVVRPGTQHQRQCQRYSYGHSYSSLFSVSAESLSLFFVSVSSFSVMGAYQLNLP